jgi:ABC-type Fe3+ transport system permease subunit
MSEVTVNTTPNAPKRMTRARLALAKPGFLLGCAIIGVSTLLALFPQVFAPYDPNFIDYLAVRQPPSWAHPFGTDSLGRDAFSRVIHAYSVNMQMAVLATVFALVIGVVVGALVGYLSRHCRYDLWPGGGCGHHLPLPCAGDRGGCGAGAASYQHLYRHHHGGLGLLRSADAG